jgi:hypothetical protein
MNEEARKCTEALRYVERTLIRTGWIAEANMAKGVARAADLIESLSAQLDQVTRERDAAVKDIRNAAFCGCHVCKQYYRPDQNVRKYACKIYGSFDEHDFIADDGSIFCGAMEWRGVEVEG